MKSKTTIVNDKKLDAIAKTIYNLVYVACNIQRSNLWLVKSKDYKKVLEISTVWRDGVNELKKIPKNNSTGSNGVHE